MQLYTIGSESYKLTSNYKIFITSMLSLTDSVALPVGRVCNCFIWRFFTCTCINLPWFLLKVVLIGALPLCSFCLQSLITIGYISIRSKTNDIG